ncbi:hypothetical protein [Streptomyces sp. NPDC046939]|uniref:hypothetical protein n=1 Tax=Streptomyces sp. NPDC046939 TaxID=3155376 RepID=UPI0033F08124
MYVYGALIGLCIVIGLAVGLRRHRLGDSVLAALASATAAACFVSLRYVEIALFWMVGSPAAGLKLLGILCLTPAPWVLAHRHRGWTTVLCGCVVATAVLLRILATDFPFPPIYEAAVLSALTRALLVRRTDPAPVGAPRR